MKKLLAIEAATEQASVALLLDGVCHFLELQETRTHAKMLLPTIDQLMQQYGVSFKTLDGIVFGQGPGSFTGLRVACSIAKGLAFAHDLPLYPVSTLQTIIYAMNASQPVLAVIDARMQQVYWTYGDQHHTTPECVSAVTNIVLPNKEPCLLAGVGFAHYELPPLLEQQISEKITCYPHAKDMVFLASQGHITPVNVADALPVYIRNQVTQGDPRG